MISADEMGGDQWQVPRDEQFPACPNRQTDGHQHLESNWTPYPAALLGGPDQPHEVGNGLRAEGTGPGGTYVPVGIEDGVRPLIEVGSDPRPRLSRPSWPGWLWTGRTRDWRGG